MMKTSKAFILLLSVSFFLCKEVSAKDIKFTDRGANGPQTAVGLEWSPYLGEMKGEEAESKCSSMGRGWRLPTKEELVSLFHSEASWKNRCVKTCYYWSSDRYFTDNGYFVGMFDGFVGNGNFQHTIFDVRCVRSP